MSLLTALLIVAAIVLALVALGLWYRRRPRDIWDKDRVASGEKTIPIEQRDVEEIIEEHPHGIGPESESKQDS